MSPLLSNQPLVLSTNTKPRSYTIPGPFGSLTDQDRELNFGWYTWTTRTQAASILTDKEAHTHRTTLPKGQMRPEIWQAQLQLARETFHPDLVEIFDNTEQPFATIISSIASTRAAFFNNRLFLIGDALAQKQPNTAQGVNCAAKDAMELVSMIEGKIRPEEWEEGVVVRGSLESLRSVAFGAKFLSSCFGALVAEWRVRVMIWRWWIWELWSGRRTTEAGVWRRDW